MRGAPARSAQKGLQQEASCVWSNLRPLPPSPPTQPLKEHNMMPVDECLDEISQCVAIIAIQTSPSVAAQHLREIADEIEDLQQSEN